MCTYIGSSYPRNSLVSVKFLAFHLRSNETVLRGDWVNVPAVFFGPVAYALSLFFSVRGEKRWNSVVFTS